MLKIALLYTAFAYEWQTRVKREKDEKLSVVWINKVSMVETTNSNVKW